MHVGLWVTPPTFPCLTLSADAQPNSETIKELYTALWSISALKNLILTVQQSLAQVTSLLE